MQKKPPKCVHPDCFNCPYVDCRYDALEASDYTETNNRDYEHYESYRGEKLHRNAGKEYRNARQTAATRGNRPYVDRHEYNKTYYKIYREEILAKNKASYDTEENTRKCQKYVKKHSKEISNYLSNYYQKYADKKREYARLRYHQKKHKTQVADHGRV